MQIEIKNRFTGSIIYSGESQSLKAAVEHCVSAKISLRGANLIGANLIGANLSGANLNYASLSGADLSGADLSGANLNYADLSGANLSGANLSGANLNYADLSGANLSGANLSGANLSGANLSGAPFAVKHLDAKLLAAIEAGGELNMRSWHFGAAHCRGGWAVILAGPAGKTLEFLLGTCAAAGLIYAASRPNKRVPNFSGDQDAGTVLEEIRRDAAEDPIKS